jgi:predicted nuclease of restriction endonuclease-like RecB superfamily
MKDMQLHMEKLRQDAEECASISKLATDEQKRELFARLAEHLKVLASEVERAIAADRPEDRPPNNATP